MKARLLGLVLASLVGTVGVAQDAPPVDKTGPAAPASIDKPVEMALHRAGSSSIDLRHLPHQAPQKRERPELEEPEANPVVLPGGPILSPNAAPKSLPVPSAPAPAPNITFDGLDFANWGAGHPPDTNGDVGPTYYIQTVNTSVGVYRKSDGVRVAAFTFNALMSQGNFGNLCDTDNFGDPVVLYDTFEDRWVITDFAFKLDASNNVINPPGAFQCFAVSKNGDPVTGGWNFYSINTVGGLGDYPKFGIWPDGIYMSANMFNYVGGAFQNPRVYAFNKAQMYAGSPTVQVVMFNAPSTEFTLLPANARLQTGTPPPGTPNYFGVVFQFLNAYSVYKFHVDWNHISTSSFTGPFISFDSNYWEQLASANQTAPTPANRNDELYPRLMMQNQYSNIGGVESLWATHTVGAGNPGASNVTATQAAVRFYQVKVTGGSVEAAPTQAWTYSPDASLWRYMPSVAVDRAGDMAIGYTTSNATTNPALAYAAQTAGVVNNIDQTEQVLWQGTGAQSGNCGSSTCTRWGDYSAMTLDPDGCTFWYTNEYYASNGLNDLTRIGSFTLPGCTPVGAGGSVSGTVTRTSDGTPLVGATVRLGSRSTTTNGSGGYSFGPVPAGTYPSMSASFPGCVTATAGTIAITDGGSATRNFSLAAQAASACLTDTTQADFQAGVLSSVDLNGSPGDVILLDAPAIDQQNSSVSPTGFGISNTSWAGQTFTPAVTGKVTRIDVELFCSGCSATSPNITVSIRATTGATPVPTGADLATATIAGFNDGGSGGLKTATFATPVTLTAGTRYAFIFRLASSFASGTMAYTCSCATTGFSNTNPYTSGQRVTSTNSGSTWTADTTVGGRDLNFRVYVDSGYALSGNFTSGTKDANPAPGYTANWSTLSWDAATPANTAVKFQAAASNDINSAFAFVGPDGTASTFFTSGASLSQFNGNRYLQYRAFLSTTDSTATPAVNDVTVCYNDVAATAASIAFGQQPSAANAGSAISPPITVRLLDSFGALAVADNSSQVSLAVASGPGTLSAGAGPVTVSSGVATFSNATIATPGTYTLNASSGALTPATSSSFVISAGAASKLVIAQQPTNATAGSAIAPAITVQVQDAGGNVVTGDTSAVTLAIGTNAGGGTLSGTVTQNAVAGVATFNNLSIDKTGAGYTLTASDGALTGTTSSPFNITPAAAASLAFNVQPSNASAGVAVAPAITVKVRDAFGNVVTGNTSAVTLAIGTNPGGGTLSGTTTQNAVAGVATFNDLSINKTGTGYTLTAVDGALTGTTSTAFNITPAAAASLAFNVQPSNATAGVSIAPAVTVQVRDAFGNVASGDTSAVTLVIGTNAGGGTLSGTATQNAVAGVATFNNLSIDKTGAGYTLTAADGSLTGTTSNTFNITPAAAANLVFNVQPSNAVAGVAIAPAITVRVRDAFGNLATSDTSAVTLAIGTNPGSGALSGTATQNAVAGVATFNDLSIDKAGTGYTLTAADGSLTGTTSNTFNITPAAAASLAFGVQPTNTTAGVAITPAVTVRVIDAFGNLRSGDNGTQVTLGVASGPGALTSGGGPLTVAGGIATFPAVVITASGTYTLNASAGALTAPASSSFTVSSAGGNKLVFGQQPSNVTAGASIAPAITVQLQDQFGNALNTSGVTVTLTASGPGAITSGASAITSSGVATFASTVIQAAGSYTVSAAATGYTGATSASFTVSPAAASKLVFGQQPSGVTAGQSISPAVTVQVQDAFDNLVSSSSASIALAIGTNPGSASLTGGGATPATSGVASFGSVSLNKAGSGYTLIASSTGLTPATSNAFAVTPAALHHLTFTTQPPLTTAAGATFGVAAELRDQFDNLLGSDTGTTVSLTLGANPGSDGFAGSSTTDAAGVATFSGIALTKAAAGYTLVANAGTKSGTSNAFAVTPASLDHVIVTTQPPATTTAGSTFGVAATLQDVYDNVLTTDSSTTVNLALTSNPGSDSYAGASVQASAGVATFGSVSLTKPASGYRLGFSAGAITVQTNTFAVTPATGAALAFVQQPTNMMQGTPLGAISVEVRDAFGNRTTADNSTSVTLTISACGGSTTIGATTVANGLAVFAGPASHFNFYSVGSGLQLQASSSGFTPASSQTFAVTGNSGLIYSDSFEACRL